MGEVRYASLKSQPGREPCLAEGAEELFWLRESDDYESKTARTSIVRAVCLAERTYRACPCIEVRPLFQKEFYLFVEFIAPQKDVY